MNKRIVLPIAAFAFGVAAFLLATWHEAPPESARAATRPRPDDPTTQSDRPVIRGGNIAIGAGTRPRFTVLRGHVRYEIRTEVWEPISDNVFSIKQPEIRIVAADGRVTYVTATDGEIELSAVDVKDVDPRRGWLRGDVQVVIDQTTHEWRLAHPERAARDDHPEELVRIWLGSEARFDIEASRLVADGQVRVQQPGQLDLTANPGVESLVIRWDQKESALSNLVFAHGGKMEVWTQKGFEPLTPSKDSALVEPTPSEGPDEPARISAIRAMATRPAPRSAEQAADEIRTAANRPRKVVASASIATAAGDSSRAGTRDAGSAASSPGKPPMPDSTETYAAIFSDNVVADWMRGKDAEGHLDCQKLEIVFDIGRAQRRTGRLGAVAEGPATSAPSTVGPPSPKAPAEADDPSRPTHHLVLNWSGQLELRPLAADPSEQTGRRFDAIASGGEVHLRDRSGSATCATMIYRHESESVWFTGLPQQPALLTATGGREVAAPEISVDRHAGVARLTGAGTMRRPRDIDGQADPERTDSAESAWIQWSDWVDITLGRTPTNSAKTAGRSGDFVRSAHVVGNVAVNLDGRKLSSRELDVVFAEPRGESGPSEDLASLRAVGQVALSAGEQALAADRLTVDFDPAGGNQPSRAEAQGNAVLTDADRRLSAEQVTATFFPRNTGERKGSDGGLVLRTLLAERSVAVTEGDPSTGLQIRATRLDADFSEDGSLARADVLGPGESSPAVVHQGDYQIIAHHVIFEGNGPRIEAEGSGTVAFVTSSDFDGRALGTPTPITIVFARGMTIDGRENLGRFGGPVTCSTTTHELRCSRELRLRFMDDKGAADSPSPARATWPWELLGMSRSEEADSSSLLGGGRRMEIRKRPTEVYAYGDASGLSTEYDDSGRILRRMRIAGPDIESNLRRRTVNVIGRGSMIVEDYRQPAERRGGTPRGGMLGASGSPSGPSQTLFCWGNGMSLSLQDGLATLDRSVEVIHRSGSEMVLVGEMAAALGADLESLRLGPGRHATLNCESLVAQFARNERRGEGDSDEGGRSASNPEWSEIRWLVAEEQVHLREGFRELLGQRLSFDGLRDEIRLYGRSGENAKMYEQDEATQRFRFFEGAHIIWNRRTGEVEAPQSSVTSQ